MADAKRLIEQFIPAHYDLHITAHTEKDDFSGIVTLEGELPKAANSITLHNRRLDVTKATAKQGKNDCLATVKNDEEQDHVVFSFKEKLKAGKITLKVVYDGSVSQNMHGFYLSTFDEDGKKRRILTTQLEADHAREAFPCVDEPEAKATFQLTLTADADQNYYSNTPVEKNKKNGDLRTVQFETTPKMSTYLLAWIIGPLERQTTKTKRGVEVGVLTTAANAERGAFALQTSADVLDFYEGYFGIDYPLPKQDMAALPDFAAGAMENWGLVTYREETLLVDDAKSSTSDRQYVALVIAHELAHQWFGNLVTMKWWDDLWLNEGFASWIEFMAVDSLFPDWNIWEQFVSSDYSGVRSNDANNHTHPIQVPIGHPAEIQQVFDAISYSKGASTIRMIHDYLGDEDFRKGLEAYLKKHKYGNAVTEDLWQALGKASGKPVSKYMSRWTTQAGLPVVHVEADHDSLKLSQERFIANPKRRKESDDTWPIALRSGGEALLLDRKSTTIKNDDLAWLNPGSTAFAYLHYNGDDWKHLMGREEDPLTRFGLLDDGWAMAKANYMSTEDFVGGIETWQRASSLVVWQNLAPQLIGLDKLSNNADFHTKLQHLAFRLGNSSLQRLGFDPKEGEPSDDALLRTLLLGLYVWFQEPATMAALGERFQQHLDGQDIHADIKSATFAAAAYYGDSKTYEQLRKLYDEAELASEKRRLVRPLMSFQQKGLFQQSIRKMQSDEVRAQEVPSWIASGSGARYHSSLMLGWMKTHWDWLESKFGGSYYMSRFVEWSSGAVSSPAELKKFETLTMKIKTPGLERNIASATESAETRVLWMERLSKELK